MLVRAVIMISIWLLTLALIRWELGRPEVKPKGKPYELTTIPRLVAVPPSAVAVRAVSGPYDVGGKRRGNHDTI
jgi:hypothetical protein